jgi:hypothetical protein
VRGEIKRAAGAHGPPVPPGPAADRASGQGLRRRRPGPALHARPLRERAHQGQYQLSHALADVFRAEIGDLVERRLRYIQLEDLGAWMPTLSGDKDFAWVSEIVERRPGGSPPEGARTAWHFCIGNAWGNKLHGMTAAGYREILPRYHEVDVDEYVLDFACREMEDADILRNLPPTSGRGRLHRRPQPRDRAARAGSPSASARSSSHIDADRVTPHHRLRA